jgi:hypothetical protein
MVVKYEALIKNQTWELIPLLKGKNIIGHKWIYKTKYGVNGQIEKHKARLVAKGFSLEEGSSKVHKDGRFIRWMSKVLSFMVI